MTATTKKEIINSLDKIILRFEKIINSVDRIIQISAVEKGRVNNYANKGKILHNEK